jgi:hypothetical protein
VGVVDEGDANGPSTFRGCCLPCWSNEALLGDFGDLRGNQRGDREIDEDDAGESCWCCWVKVAMVVAVNVDAGVCGLVSPLRLQVEAGAASADEYKVCWGG